MFVALAVSEFTEELLAYKRNSLHLLHPGFPLVALYKESNLLTLFKSDIKIVATGKWKGKAGQNTEITLHNIRVHLY